MSNVTINGLPTAVAIDAIQDYLPIYTASSVATQKISRNTFLGITGSPLGTTDGQTVSTKTIDNSNTVSLKDTLFTLQDDSDTTKRAQFQLSGLTTATTRTYTWPDRSSTVATLGGNQTFTGNITISGTTATDTVNGSSVSNTGTIYGISVAVGVITTANSVQGTALTNTSITANKLNLGAQATIVTTSETTTNTSYTDLATTTDQVTVTVGTNGLLEIGIYASFSNSGTGASYISFALSGANTQAAADTFAILESGIANAQFNLGNAFLVNGLTPGSTTVKLKYRVQNGTGTYANRRVFAIPL